MVLGVAGRVLLLVALLALGGCYKTRVGVVERGERVPGAGEFDCVHVGRDGGFSVVMTEVYSGRGAYGEYRYFDPDGRGYKLARLPSGLYLVQTGSEGDYEYEFVEFLADGSFTTLVEDSDGRWQELVARLARSGLHFRQDGVQVVLRGSPDRLRAYLFGHERSLMRETSRCVPHRR